MPRLNEIMSKKQNAESVHQGEELSERPKFIDFARLPSFSLPVDICFGGGIPLNVLTQFFGPPHGGKTTLALQYARALQHFCIECVKPFGLCDCKKPETGKTLYIHLEGLPDTYWFDVIGVNTRGNDPDVVISVPEYGEKACDQVEAAVKSDDCNLVILDSLAGLISKGELEKSYEDAARVGDTPLMVSRFIKRLNLILPVEHRRGHRVAVIAINQIRARMDAGRYGPTETTPGGFGAKHGFRLSARCSQLSADKKDVDDDSGLKNLMTFSTSIQSTESKQQLLVLASKAEYKLAGRAFEGYPAGSVYDLRFLVRYAKEHGFLEKTAKGYNLLGYEFQKITDIEEQLKQKPYLAASIKWDLVNALKDRYKDGMAEVANLQEVE